MASLKKTCIYCEPVVSNPYHLEEKFLNYFYDFSSFLFRPFETAASKILNRNGKLEKYFIEGLIKILAKINVVKISPITGNIREKIANRTLVIVDEAEKRGYLINAVKFLNRYTNIFQLVLPNTTMFFYALPLLNFIEEKIFDTSDKYLFKSFLKNNNFPHAKGNCFRNQKSAFKYALNLGFPLVVKPRQGSLSKHTTINIKNGDELKKAIAVAKIISNEIIVEKHVEGENYRVIVVDNKFIACALRERPYIMGDKIHTIKQLIEKRNSSRRHKLEIKPGLIKFLKNQGVDLNHIPSQNQKFFLSDKITLAAGADIYDVTDLIHKDNVRLFEKINKLINAPLMGFDVITNDISKPYYRESFAIIETNSAPYIDMHHFPDFGESRNVASAVIDAVEKRHK